MFIRFVISNFLSFDTQTEFNMLTAPGKHTHHKHHIYKAGTTKIVKSTAIWGANGAGKSNLVDAILTFQQWVKDGEIRTSADRQKFRLKAENKKLPVSFAIEFFTEKKLLLYGLSVDDYSIIKEFLYEGKKHNVVFEHDTPQQKLHLSSGINHPLIKAAFNWIVQQLIIRRPKTDIEEMLQLLCTNPAFFDFSNNLLGTFDTGIDCLTLEKKELSQFLAAYYPTNPHPNYLSVEKSIVHTVAGRVFITKENGQIIVNLLKAFHHGFAFDLIEESHGTQRLLEFIPIFWLLIHEPVTIFIDEIDQNIHPVLLIALIRKINHTSTKGQLIFTTHESNLLDLDLFRKDEIWFAVKENETGATELHNLSEYKNITSDLDPQKGYLMNRFKAIPATASLELLKL